MRGAERRGRPAPRQAPRSERPRDALAVLDLCLREGCDDAQVAWEAALAAFRLDQYDVQLTYLDKFESMTEADAWACYYRATALLELKAVDTTVNPVEAEQGKEQLPPTLQLLFQRDVDENRQVLDKRPIIVQRQPIITGSSLTSAEVRPDDQGGWLVAFTLDSQGARTFGDFTGANIGRQLAIVLDDTVYSAPVIRSPISIPTSACSLPHQDRAARMFSCSVSSRPNHAS